MNSWDEAKLPLQALGIQEATVCCNWPWSAERSNVHKSCCVRVPDVKMMSAKNPDVKHEMMSYKGNIHTP